VFLNRKARQQIVKVSIITTTNLGVLAFSMLLGFNSGVYLYFFVAPMLVYLIFDFNQKAAIYINLLVYLSNFLLIVFLHHLDLFEPVGLKESLLEWIFNINFIAVFILCFSLIIYFSNNNYNYINQLKQSNHEKDVLLSEINHRVKNNLGVISGLNDLQSLYLTDESAMNILNNSTRRIKAIALLHEKLYNSGNYENISWNGYLEELIQYICHIFPAQSSKVKFDLNIPDLKLKIKEAMPLALVINELITNSLKYAFDKSDNGVIAIEMVVAGRVIKIKITDNGCGFDLKEKQMGQSLGLSLMDALSRQLGNEAEFTSGPNGTSYQLTFYADKQN
jgi:two-component sensor histidine kinase